MKSTELKSIKIAEALYGIRESEGVSLLYDQPRAKYLPVQTSPLKEYVQDVNRFLFSGGVGLSSYGDLPDNHPSIPMVNKLVNNSLNPILDSLWENVAISGELLALVKFDYRYVPTLEWFDKREYEAHWKEGSLFEVKIKTTISIDDIEYVYKLKVDRLGYYEYPLVKLNEARYYEWEKNLNFVEHSYNVVPCQIVKLNPSIQSNRGKGEFTLSALNLAKTITFLEYGLDENVEFLGNPLIDSPDPKATRKALNRKSQVLQKLPQDEGGGHTLLQPQPLTSSELEYLKFKKSEFRRLMGITNTTETQLNDPSGTALRLMNDGLISKAQSKWSQLVESNGLNRLLDLVAFMAHRLNIISLGDVEDVPEIFKLQRNQPLFSMSSNEKIQALNVAQMLVDLGVDRIHALKETVYNHLSLKEIEQKLRVNLEDVL